jgi:hypothetical protein
LNGGMLTDEGIVNDFGFCVIPDPATNQTLLDGNR